MTEYGIASPPTFDERYIEDCGLGFIDRPLPLSPCLACGWCYPESTLRAHRAGSVSLDRLPTHPCQPRRIGTIAECDCGMLVEVYGPSEDQHYVWAVRRDGTRSNLGYCPIRHGLNGALMRAEAALSGRAVKGWEQ